MDGKQETPADVVLAPKAALGVDAAPQQKASPRRASKNAKGSAVSSAPPKKNPKLLDKYVLGKLLGQGAFGVVYKCRRKGTNTDCAVKMIDQVETPLDEIKKEVEMLEVLKHPTMIALHEVFYEKVFVCMVLELYKGGDMIQGMMQHWKSKGMVPMGAVQHLTKQMWESMAFLHSRNFVHRDVKGDNFMMDMPDVENPAQRIYLSDFGTVEAFKPGERKNSKCGTKNYWAPEFYKLNYGHKVDCWAVGVIMFGFFSGKFPFKNQQEVEAKKPQIHARVGEDGAKLLSWAFQRDENERCEASQAVQHPFVSSKDSAPEVGGADSVIGPEIREFGANAGVKERRRELVDRLVKNAKQYQDSLGLPAGSAGFEPVVENAVGRRNSATVETVDAESFRVRDPFTERSTVFQWTRIDKAKKILQVMEQGRHAQSMAMNNDINKQSIQQQLKDHDINLESFGKGKAKPLDEFIEEIQMGKARLLIDATRPKFLVRGVAAVLLRIFIKIPTGKFYLTERQEKYPDGRIRESGQLPGNKTAPHENSIQAATRLVEELLHMQDCGIHFDFGHIESQEQGEDSPSYPGVHTVYIKETVTGVVTVKSDEVLKRLGLAEGGSSSFDVEDSAHYTRSFQWMTEDQCKAANIQLFPCTREDDISALVGPPVGLSEEDLFAYLGDNNVDVSKWGEGTARSVADFSEELSKGESALLRQDGRVVRVVDIVVLKITKIGDDGSQQVIREVEEEVQQKTSQLDRLPATKRRADEHPFAAARRMISKHLCLDNNMVTLDPDDVRIVEEEQESTSYPGMLSIYRKRFMSATLKATPIGRLDSSR